MTNPAGTRFAEQFVQAQNLHQQGQLPSAQRIYLEILAVQPDHFDALNAMGVLSGQFKDPQQAIQYFDRAIAIQPGNAGPHCNRGLALKQLNLPDAALASFDQALALDGNNAIAHYSRAETCKELGLTDEALSSYDKAIALNPGFWQACFRRGALLQQGARLDAAIASYDQTLRIKPDHAEALANRAFTLSSLGRHAEALADYDRAAAMRPDHAPLYLHRGNVLKELNRLDAALTSYDQAIAIKPDYAEASANRGIVLQQLGRAEEALRSFDHAIAVKPDYAEAYFNRAYLLRMMKRLDAAAADYKIAAALAPGIDFLHGARLETSLQACDWSEFDALVGQITAGIENDQRASHPFTLLALVDSARLQHKAARIWVRHACPADGSLGQIGRRPRRGKLRIGYFSADFRDHPISYLLAELIETHDRSQFDVIAFAFGPATEDDSRRRLVCAFDSFIEVQDKSDLETASLARSLDVDIAVDLGGYTHNSRTNIFALRAAPLQVSYLGYLGTMGASYMDYIVADRTLITPGSEPHFAEKVIYLPESYQVNDRKRRIADKMFTRRELGLPASGFVFCCFNGSYKILPATFAGWMRILKRVPGSVLLLLAGNSSVESNLRAYAAQKGVDPQRLVFGEQLARPAYLARYRAAGLFLDTLPYNAGTTASDALWTGLPVLTLAGEAFASRVAASLLNAIGLPELVTTTQQQYEELAVELALNPERLARIRAKLAENRPTSPLFDTPRFTRNLEAAYLEIYDRYHSGLPPEHIRIPALR